jgi:hypothetical protein
MIKYFIKLLIVFMVMLLVIPFTCRRKLDIAPYFTNALPDTIPIYKNGWCTFYLDTIVNDDDDDDTLIQLTVSTNSLLTVRYKNRGQVVELVPARNQTDTTTATFTAIDPFGYSCSKICIVIVQEPNFQIWLTNSVYDTFSMNHPDTIIFRKDTIIRGNSEPTLINRLEWKIYTDTSHLRGDDTIPNSIRFITRTGPDTTGIYFEVTDPLNHITLPHSTLVFIR